MIPTGVELIVVTPVYEDLEASSRLFRELDAAFGGRLFILAVDDGSVRQPLPGNAFAGLSAHGAVVKLRRNVGHQRAIAIGLGVAADYMTEKQCVVVMDSDGEDLPGTIPPLLAALNDPQVDVAVAQRKSRVETLRFKAFYEVYKRLFAFMTGRAITFGNFMAFSFSAVRRLAAMQELPIHVAAATLASKLRLRVCPLDRGPRYAGQSKMNFVGLALHGFRALMVFAEDVLVRVGLLCVAIAAFSVLGGALAIGLKLAGFATPGWFSVAFGILLLTLLQTGTLALMMLMLTGVVRSGSVTSAAGYKEFIDCVLVSGERVRLNG
ncbi:glycosyltransferase [Uliginosibacterium aquaticum]|uniref:Glycosyltransferase n=1 Tax=Uliginosibacterium aquaticum TaxID=2731212 RepID=A0ABX2IBZ9_9RHOO|nr:glycosyltransferase [Uliginosibacterium aquaticum]NSL53762.1 glycosyltransferase [Uliginosibacterium aquaticum]